MSKHGLFSVIVIAAMLMTITAATAVCGEGGISTDYIQNLQKSFALDSFSRAVYNAVTNTSINDLALNRDIVRNSNDLFNHKLKVKGITSQESSGRCWLFASLSLIRSYVINKYKMDDFEFSQNYLAFWDKFEKANTFLEYIIEFRDRDPLDRELESILESPDGDGGYFRYTVDLIGKYGAVPKDIMPETKSSGHTALMNKILALKLRHNAGTLRQMYKNGSTVEELRNAKEGMLPDIYRLLVINLGEPPTEFTWRYKTNDSTLSDPKQYTPQSFYKDFVGIDLSEYVNIFNNPTKEYGLHIKGALSRNMYDREDIDYANVSMDVIRQIALKSVLNDDPVAFSADVSEDQDSKQGIMAKGVYDYQGLFDTDLGMDKTTRALLRQNSANHLMVIVGVDTTDGKSAKWRVENSWGEKSGNKGYWTMYNDWFDMYGYNIIVKKKYVPKDVMKIFDKEPVVIPYWDPMTGKLR